MRSFTGAPADSKNGDIFVPHPDAVKYTEIPSPEFDHTWAKLVEGKFPTRIWYSLESINNFFSGRYFLVTEEEAKEAWDHDYENYWSYDRGYVAG